MTKIFVDFKLAHALKDVGFDAACVAYYGNTPRRVFLMSAVNNVKDFYWPVAPTYDQVVDWLFKKGLHLHTYYLSDANVWGCDIYTTKGDLLRSCLMKGKEDKRMKTYAERLPALKSAIKEAIKLIKNGK